ncbi:hypothetical protein FO488_15970 [Geobacter sp. FeAm09]|uniref:hypothetical protein n=1 Tax=Geobacter sp. FeAm09 TaxID=2597769 RepID=UPI0011F06215|nr:hypothetical protein [Geobacter sp. FeAm09]QEM69505.1 hypothetical protein FO488_15970 [Geobacter sp. FeAm09]
MRTLILFTATAILLLSAAAVVAETNTGYSTEGGQSSNDGRVSTFKLGKDKRHSDSNSRSTTTSAGDDEQIQSSIKQMRDARKSRELDVSRPAQAVFLDYLLTMEAYPSALDGMPQRQLVEVIRRGRLSNPLFPANVGLGASSGKYSIDETRKGYLHSQAGNSARLLAVGGDEAAVIAYAHDLAILGAIIGQAYLFLADDISALQTKIAEAEGRKGRSRLISAPLRDATGRPRPVEAEITEIGAEDFQRMALGALIKVFREGIKDTWVKSMSNRLLSISDESGCVLKGAIDTVRVSCGPAILTFGNPAVLEIAGIQWAGTAFAGFEGRYRLSSAWSYSETLDHLQSIGKSSRIASDYAKRSEDSLSKGKSVDAVWDLREGVERSAKSSNSVNSKGGGKQ